MARATSPFMRFFFEMVRRYRGPLVIALVFAFVSAGGLGVGLVSLGPILKIILAEDGGKSLAQLAAEYNADPKFVRVPDAVVQRLPTDPFAGVAVTIGALLVLTVLGAMANFIHQYLSQTVTTKMVADIRRDAFTHVLQMPLARVVQRGPSEFVARMVRDAAELQRGLIALVSRSVAQLTKGAAAYVAALAFEWKLTLLATIVAPILAIALRKIGKRIRRGTRGSLGAQEGLLRVATESLQGLRPVKAGCAEPAMGKRFDAVNDEVVHHELRIRTARALSGPLVELMAVIAVAGLALIAARSILTGSLPFDRFLLALACLGVAGGAFRPLAGLINEVYAASAPAQRLLDVLGDPVEASGSGDMPPLAAPDVGGRTVTFESVTYTYPASERPALDDVTLTIEAGERVAIVGPNGSGKTTLVSLVPRLLVPVSGVVRIDGTDLDGVALRALRREIGVVTQETFLFKGTVAENIVFGLDGVSRADVQAAARGAHADDFIERLSGGYDADLAEQGASLSGGQRQRLAIARAILRDPRVLILDEATSQIDAESDARISDALREFCRGRTTLIVAHRLATVLNADRIVVMDQGAVVDQAPHDVLFARCPLYRRLTETQLLGAG